MFNDRSDIKIMRRNRFKNVINQKQNLFLVSKSVEKYTSALPSRSPCFHRKKGQGNFAPSGAGVDGRCRGCAVPIWRGRV